MELAEQAGLSELIGAKVSIKVSRVKSAGVNPAGKIASIVAGLAAGADCIDDLQVVRSGGMSRLFEQVYAPATLGQLLREFTYGHARQLESVMRAHLVELVGRTGCLPGIQTRCYIDIDSLLRPVYGHAKQGASFGHTKISGKQVLRRGLSPLATTISTDTGAPMIVGMRLRGGKAGSGRGAGSMVTEAITAARAAGADAEILIRGDSAYGSTAVIKAAISGDAMFSVVLTKNPAVQRAIDSIAEHEWVPVNYPGATLDPDTEELISDAQVAEVAYTAFATTKHPVTARLIVRRVKDQNHLAELFPVWRHHPFFTNTTETTVDADITHRRHAVIETTFADLINGPLAHLPSGRFGANCAWAICAGITHNLLRSAAALAGGRLTTARGATLRTRIINVPARLARPQRKPVLHLPAHWPWTKPWNQLWTSIANGPAPPLAA